MANFVMSLASSPSLAHPVELSASPFCHYHYSNLTKVLRDWEVSESDFRAFIRRFVPAPRFLGEGIRYYALTHDVTKMLKAHSPCLEGRQYVPTANNVIASNRALGVGYHQGFYNLGLDASDSNPDALLAGFLKLWSSVDGAASFTCIGGYCNNDFNYVHPDCQEIEINDNDVWMISDGGIEYWAPYNDGLPFRVATCILRPFYRDNKLRLGAYGKGVWEAPFAAVSQPVAQAVTPNPASRRTVTIRKSTLSSAIISAFMQQPNHKQLRF